jgi:hypothetical protein
MPIHDWAHVRANRFHHFHQTWTSLIATALNRGLLPRRYFAMLSLPINANGQGSVSVEVDEKLYARKANRVTVRDPDGEVVAVIEIVSPGNKHAVRSFVRKAVNLLLGGVHFLVVDLFPPSKRDPQGIHKLLWDRIRDEDFALPPDKPLTLAAYSAGSTITAYVEPIGVGDRMPDVPIFLTADRYVPCPLEATYQASWDAFPQALKAPLGRTPEDPGVANG